MDEAFPEADRWSPTPRPRPATPRGARRRSAHADRREVEHARLLARVLDDAIPIPGTSYRIGLDPLLGLVPGVGDLLGAVLSTWILVVASRLGAPPTVIARMGLNLALDALVGLVPVAGDLFDVGWKANARNLRLLEGWLDRPGPTQRSSAALVVAIAALLLAVAAAVAWAGWQVVGWAAARLSGG
jgi:hypothetical protein